MTVVPNFAALPTGTVLQFRTTNDNTVEVKLISPHDSPRYGQSTFVKAVGTSRKHFKHPDGVVMKAAIIPDDTHPDTFDFFAQTTSVLKPGVSVVLDDYIVEPTWFIIAEVHVIPAS